LLDSDPDPGGQKLPTNIEKSKKIHVLKYWMFFFEAEGFSCCLCALYGGLGITKLQFLSKNINFLSCKFFSIFGHQNLGFRTGSVSGSAIMKNAGSGSALIQCGFTTLVYALEWVGC
jgi:hypothetical protein